MSDSIVSGIVTVLLAVIGLAIIAALISGKSQTASVVTAGGSAFSGILGSALQPISGGSLSLGFSGPTGSLY